MKFPKATECLEKNRGELLSFFALPSAHWPILRMTNPIKSTFGTIQHRTARTKGCITGDGMLHMIFKVGQCAENTWRRVRGVKQLPKVIVSIQFIDGIEQPVKDPVAA